MITEEIYPIDFEYKPTGIAYNGSNGSFGWINTPTNKTIHAISWETCREMFTWHFINPQKPVDVFEFIFHHFDKGGINVARFIHEVENKLKIENQTQFHGFIHQPTFSIIFPNKWWFKNQLRIQLFSILMRCGQYYQNDFDVALNNSYAGNTKKAVHKFLDGFTKYAGEEGLDVTTPPSAPPTKMTWKHGWFWLFANDQNLDLLIQPDNV